MVTVKSQVGTIADVESQRRSSDVLMDGMRLRYSKMGRWELVVLVYERASRAALPVAPGRAPRGGAQHK